MTNEIFFIPYKNGNGTLVDFDFTNPIHCLNWYDDGGGYARAYVYKNKTILLHRLLLNFPEEVDHINGKRNDNRMKNLRSVSRRNNQQNRDMHRDGKLPGCHFRKDIQRWQSQIWINGKNKHLGFYDTEQEAHERYKEELDG